MLSSAFQKACGSSRQRRQVAVASTRRWLRVSPAGRSSSLVGTNVVRSMPRRPNAPFLCVSSSVPVVPPHSPKDCYGNAMSFFSTSARSASDKPSSSSPDGDNNSNNNGGGNSKQQQQPPPPPPPQIDNAENASESFEETVRRMKSNDDTSSSSSFFPNNNNNNELFSKLADYYDSFRANISEAWQELVESGRPKDINKKIHLVHPTATPEGEKPYDGVVDIMVIDEAEELTAWERMQRRLTEAPIIQTMLERGHVVYEQSGAKQAKQQLDHLSEDAKEAWETSQNPWVYRVSSVYDTLTAESEFAVAVRELRKLDPHFTLEEWKQDVVEHTLPQIMQWFLEGRINQLKPWLGEGVFKRIAAEITARQQEGVQIDTHVLGIMNSEILACEPDEVNKGSPIILLHFMCQQINCVKKKKDGAIVEGSEDDIRANSYVCAFQREYNEEEGELNWKIVDFRFNGAIAYI